MYGKKKKKMDKKKKKETQKEDNFSLKIIKRSRKRNKGVL